MGKRWSNLIDNGDYIISKPFFRKIWFIDCSYMIDNNHTYLNWQVEYKFLNPSKGSQLKVMAIKF